MSNDQNAMIPGYPRGSNLTIINTIHRRIKSESGKSNDLLDIVYKDNETGLKHVEEIIDPIYTYWIAKEDHRVPYNRLFIPKDEAHPCEVVYKKLESDIAKRLGISDWYYNNFTSGNASENRKIHCHPNVFMSDMNLEDFYRFKFSREYQNEPTSITKAFFDIEVDTRYMAGDFPDMGECPINSISFLFPQIHKVFVFLLKTKENPLIEDFIKSVKDKTVFSELKDFIVDAIGGQAKVEKMGLNNLEIQFLFYDEENEIKLIMDLFRAINSFMPDFVLAWNMAFDIPYIIARIQRLGYKPEDIMAHPDFGYKFAEYYIDERNANSTAERCDFAKIASYSIYMDQMIQFASRRKGQTKFTSYSLDSIGETVAKVRKLDYKSITTSLTELPYKNYKIFVFYNIMDTLVQACIEANTGDIDYVFAKCNDNNTRYSKAHRQTVFLYTKGAKEFYNNGFIIGNNVNSFNEKPKEKFPGAFVADPIKAGSKSKMKLNGIPVSVWNNSVDWDYASLYPSTIRQFNIAVNTQIGQIKIPNQVNAEKENRFNDDKWTRESQFMEDFQSHEWLEIATRWFGLPNYFELYSIVKDIYTDYVNPIYGLKRYEDNGEEYPMVFDESHKLTQPMVFENPNDYKYYEVSSYVDSSHVITDRKVKEIQDYARSNQTY